MRRLCSRSTRFSSVSMIVGHMYMCMPNLLLRQIFVHKKSFTTGVKKHHREAIRYLVLIISCSFHLFAPLYGWAKVFGDVCVEMPRFICLRERFPICDLIRSLFHGLHGINTDDDLRVFIAIVALDICTQVRRAIRVGRNAIDLTGQVLIGNDTCRRITSGRTQLHQ